MNVSSVPSYKASDYPPFAVTADLVLFTIEDEALQVLLVERGQEPYKGVLALPGGFVREDENLNQAAARELAEETGLQAADCNLEQLASYGTHDRDPRMRVVTVAYWAVCAGLQKVRPGGDAAATAWVPVERIESGEFMLAFDHRVILRDARERLSAKLEYTALGAGLLPPAFRVSDLRQVYDIVWKTELDPGNFQRGFHKCGAFHPSSQQSPSTPPDRGRPASLWMPKSPAKLSTTVLKRPIARRSIAPARHTKSS